MDDSTASKMVISVFWKEEMQFHITFSNATWQWYRKSKTFTVFLIQSWFRVPLTKRPMEASDCPATELELPAQAEAGWGRWGNGVPHGEPAGTPDSGSQNMQHRSSKGSKWKWGHVQNTLVQATEVTTVTTRKPNSVFFCHPKARCPPEPGFWYLHSLGEAKIKNLSQRAQLPAAERFSSRWSCLEIQGKHRLQLHRRRGGS